eukprot:COSAG02_NODE_4693_length_5088_cov_3.016837_2_plen_69_part_00
MRLSFTHDKEHVFPYTRKSGKVKGHCRNLHAPRRRVRKAKPDPRLKQLEKMIQKRANLLACAHAVVAW